MKHGYSLLLALLLSATSYARENTREITGAEKTIASAYSDIPEYIQFKKDFFLPVGEFATWAHSALSLPPQFGFKLLSTEEDQIGMKHYRYQQTYNGVPLVNTMYIVHTRNGLVVSMNGAIFNKVAMHDAVTLDEKTALSNALRHTNAAHYRWQNPHMEQMLKNETGDPSATWYPKAEMFYVAPKGDISSRTFHLTYRFDIYADEPLLRDYVYVDASSGSIVHSESRIRYGNTIGTAVTGYSGTRAITTDSTGVGAYRLRETGRGNGIETYNLKKGTSYTNTDFTDTDNYWNNVNSSLDQYATDAHWGAEVTYDFFKNKFNRNSINGNGFKLLNYVHYSSGYVNAFWDGSRMTFGDGGGGYLPLTSIDIEAHEITHGLTNFTSNLGGGEAGALNEGFSDCMAYAIRYYGKGVLSWRIGDEIGGGAFRNSQTPNATGNPDTYKGTYWDPNGEVHNNSTVLSHWYYLLTVGGSGTNDIGSAYSVTGVGLDTATAICYRMNTVYLFSSATYESAKTYAIQAALDLYGGCSNAVKQTQNAWYAVGLGTPYVDGTTGNFSAPATVFCSAPASVTFKNTSSNASSFTWNFGDGGTSTSMNPTHVYNAPGVYTVTLIADGGAKCGVDTFVRTNYIDINPNNPCIISLPTSGAGAIQTACAGQLYDNGGPAANYLDQTENSITIAPIGAAKVTLTFSSFGYETNYDYLYIYNGPTTASPLIGKYTGTGLPNGGTVSSTGSSITIRHVSDQFVTGSGFALTWQCTLANVKPTAYFSATTTSSCTGTVQFNDSSINGPTGWKWSFGDGATDTIQNPTHTYTSSGTYTVKLTAKNAIGVDSTVRTDYVTINLPEAPSPVSASICAGSAATLSATGQSTLTWFSSPTGNTVLDTGSIYNTGPLAATTTYYVESRIQPPAIHAGPVSNAFGSGSTFQNTNYLCLKFNTFTDITLVSVKVYALGSQNRTVILKQNGTTINTKTVSIPDGTSRVTLNFFIPAGSNYELGLQSTTFLYRNNSGAAFPYTIPGVLSITGNNAGAGNEGYYYYYYDWEVQMPACISARIPVIANVDTSLKADFTSNTQGNTINFFENALGNPLTYEWDFGDSASVNNTSSSQNPSHTYSKAGTYIVCLTVTDGEGCANAICKSIAVNVVTVTESTPDNNAITVYPNPAADVFTVSFRETYHGKSCVLKLTDLLGQVVDEKVISNVGSSYLYNVSAFAAGSYVLVIQTEKDRILRKITKQ